MTEKEYEGLNNNPAWKKAQCFCTLQDIFLIAAINFAIIGKILDADHPYWYIAFFVFGVLSVIFGRLSISVIQKYFVRKSDCVEI